MNTFEKRENGQYDEEINDLNEVLEGYQKQIRSVTKCSVKPPMGQFHECLGYSSFRARESKIYQSLISFNFNRTISKPCKREKYNAIS